MALAVMTSIAGASCSAPQYHPDAEGLARFNAAGPIQPEFDEQRLLDSIQPPGVYTVVPGDLLVLRVPPSMATSVVEGLPQTSIEHFARVSKAGSIEVPLAGTTEVAGLSVQEIEAQIADRVYPELLSERPSIVVTVQEATLSSVTIYGAVGSAGVHQLRSDELTLSAALSAAGGIRSGEGAVGARRVVVYRPGRDDEPDVVALPVRGLDVPFYDMPLEGGERIEVERWEPDLFTVVGLVSSQGAYPFPAEQDIHLIQAIAMAGGPDGTASPPYATIFRQDYDTGEILPATFEIKGDALRSAIAIPIKPGDVISLGHTAGTWTRTFAAEIFQIRIGYNFSPNASF
ncbi:polysaccharide biosynthesis/export family protein [Planctomycetota bacterium]|nr:polysaccharide biosynthesis/export family protein [Planctomycetota bacterium]MDB4736191.1 polysaccharide biosynthesis/export family protein [Planctomycetota bacterium]